MMGFYTFTDRLGFLRYRQGAKPNLALFASRRGGSSILSELIASDPSIREIDQPFDRFQPQSRAGRTRIRHLPPRKLSQFFNLSEAEQAAVDRYLRTLLRGGYPALSKTAFRRKTRTLLKIVNAPFLLDDLAARFHLRTVYLSRHPVPQALSVLRNGWGFTTEAYLEDRAFLRRFLTERQYAFAERLQREGGALEKAVLNWVFENLYPLRHATRIDCRITYEALVLDPGEATRQIAASLDLALDEAVLATPSRSRTLSDVKTNEAIATGDKSFLVNKWKDEIGPAERRKLQAILDGFEIEAYAIA